MIVESPPSSASIVVSSVQLPSVLLRLRLIGQMEAWTFTSESVMPTGRKTRALLAVLALSAPRPVLRGRLAQLLWSRRPEEQARASLRQEIHRLGEALSPVGGQVLAVHRDHLMLRSGVAWIDVEEVMRATPEQPAALMLLDGELLEDLNGIDPCFDAWLAGERERLSDRARGLAERLLEEKPDPGSVIAAAEQLLAIDRSHEGAWRALMRAHAARGERGMALQAYERCRGVLAERLDAHPSEETQRVAAEIRAAAPVHRPAPPPLPPPLPAPVPASTRLDTRMLIRAQPRLEPRPEVRGPAPRGGVRVGVLPLQMIGTGAAESHLSAGLADEITAALARFRWLFLVSSSSLAQFTMQSRDETAIRRSFSLDFLLDGNIQRLPDRLRVTLRLLDLRAGNQVVWSRRFDRALADLPTLQDEVAAEVVAQIDPEILLIEAHRLAARPPSDASAYELLLRSVPLLSEVDRAQFMRAGELLRQAIVLDPDYSAAHAWYALWHIFRCGHARTAGAAELMAEAGRLANRAITLDPQDARGMAIAAHVRACLQGRLREALALHELALNVNPNLAMAWALSAAAFAILGDFDEAERRMRRYKKLSPLDPHAFFYDTTFIVLALLRHNHEEAVAIGREVSDINPVFSMAYKPYLAALGWLGRTEEAVLVRQRLLAIEPDLSIPRFLEMNPFERAEDRAHVITGLRLAGVKGT